MSYPCALDAAITLGYLANPGRRERNDMPVYMHKKKEIFAVADVSDTHLIHGYYNVTCVINDDSSVHLTNTAMILQNLEIEHPVGQYVVSICQTFHKKHGCGVKTLLFMIGSFARALKILKQQGIPSSCIIKHMRQVVAYCCEKMDDIKIPVLSKCGQQECSDLSGHESLHNVTDGQVRKVDNEPVQEFCMDNSMFGMLSNSKRSEKPEIVTENVYQNQNSENYFESETFMGRAGNVGLVNTIHLEMKNVKHPGESDDDVDDIDWFFEDTDPVTMKNNQIQNRNDSREVICANGKRTDNLTDGGNVEITSMKNDSGDDSEFDECFDDVPNIVQMKTVTTIPHVHQTPTIATKLKSLEYDDTVLLHLQKHIGANNYSTSLGLDNSDIGAIQRHSDQNTQTESKCEEGETDDDFSLCFENSKFEKSSKLLNSQKCIKQGEISDCSKISPTQMEIRQLDKLLGGFSHRQSSKAQILNNCRHFKTMESTVSELKGSRLDHGKIVNNGIQNEIQEDISHKEKYGRVQKNKHGDMQGQGPKDSCCIDISHLSHVQRNIQTYSEQKTENENRTRSTARKQTQSVLAMLEMIDKKMASSAQKTIKEGLRHSRHFKTMSDSKISEDSWKSDSKWLTGDKVPNRMEVNGKENCEISGFVAPPLDPKLKVKVNDSQNGRHDIDISDVDKDDLESVRSGSCRQKNGETHNDVRSVANGLSHGSYGVMDAVMRVVNRQCQDKAEGPRLDVNTVNCLTLTGPLRDQSIIVSGMVVPVAKELLPLVLQNPGQLRAIIINGDISPTFHHKGYRKMLTGQTIVTAAEYPSVVSAERQWRSDAEKTLGENHINVVLARGHIEENFQLSCVNQDIITIGDVSYKMLLSLCVASQVSMATYLEDISEENIINGMKIAPVDTDWKLKSSDSSFVMIQVSKNPIQTVIYSHPATSGCNLFEQEFWRCAHSLSSALRSEFVLPGGGSTELFCSKELVSTSESYLKHLDDADCDFYIPRIWEEMAQCFQNFCNTVCLNTNNLAPNCVRRQTVVASENNKHGGNENCVLDSKFCADCGKFNISEFQPWNCGKNENESWEFCKYQGQSDVYDNMETKKAAWRTACDTVITISRLDMHIVTGDGSQTGKIHQPDRTILKL